MITCKLSHDHRAKLMDHYLEYYKNTYGMDHPHKAKYINKYLLEEFNATPEPWTHGMPDILYFEREKDYTVFLLTII